MGRAGDLLVTGHFTGASRTAYLRYIAADGFAEMYGIEGIMTRIQEYSGWRSSWVLVTTGSIPWQWPRPICPVRSRPALVAHAIWAFLARFAGHFFLSAILRSRWKYENTSFSSLDLFLFADDSLGPGLPQGPAGEPPRSPAIQRAGGCVGTRDDPRGAATVFRIIQ